MNEKQRLIRELSVALPVCKCAYELQLETIKWEDLLNKTYEKQVYKTPFITAVINGGGFFYKMVDYNVYYSFYIRVISNTDG